MNAHQRRTERRKVRWVFDLETRPFAVGGFVPDNLIFSFASIRPRGERLSDTLTILKGRENAHNRVYDNLCATMDFTRLEEMIEATLVR